MKRFISVALFIALFLIGLTSMPLQAKSGLTSLCFAGDSNCYLYGRNGVAVIIDASVDAGSILHYANQEGLKVKYIILTHGHWDHVSYIEDLKNATKAKVVIHKLDITLLQQKHRGFRPDSVVNGGEIIKAGDMSFEIIHTPGHTPGSICIKESDMLFSGDTLFKMSVGRTDFEGGSTQDMIESLKKLIKMEDQVIVCPGHGETTTIGFEKANNPFLQ
jgi:glyoxylase-like metal-dependent hydrolase (beta-lactamase superfamily II)